ncbi:MAG: tyrosine-type recombinase/integrase [Elusimicrobiota bacterium]
MSGIPSLNVRNKPSLDCREYIEQWKQDPKTGRQKNYASAVSRILKTIKTPLEELTPEILDAGGKKITDSWKFREKVLIALRHFVDWCYDQKLIATKPILRRNALGTFREIPMPEPLKNELISALRAHRTKRIGEPLKPEVFDNVMEAVDSFHSIVSKAHPGRTFKSLADFNPQDMVLFQKTLEREGSRYKGKPLSPRTIRGHLGNILIAYRAAKRHLGWTENPMDAFELPRYDFGQRDTYLTKGQVDSICSVPQIEGKPLRDQFIAVRNAAMARVQYDMALRAEEVVKLASSDLRWDRLSKGGVIPVAIRGSKARPAGNEELQHLTPLGIEAVKLYLDFRDKYCSMNGITIQPADGPHPGKDAGVPLFISSAGHPVAVATYESKIFPDLVRKAGLEQTGATSHTLRHSRISHWLEDGIPIDRVSQLARHRNVNFTMKSYSHYLPGSIKDIIERLYGKKPETAPILTKELLPEASVLRQIIKAVQECQGAKPDEQAIKQLESALREKIQGKDGRAELCYTVPQTMEKLNLGRTQIYEWMHKGILHAIKLANDRKGLPKDEVDALAELRSTKEASAICGIKEKAPTTIPYHVRQGNLEAMTISGHLFFTNKALSNFLLWRNSHKQHFGTRPHAPQCP